MKQPNLLTYYQPWASAYRRSLPPISLAAQCYRVIIGWTIPEGNPVHPVHPCAAKVSASPKKKKLPFISARSFQKKIPVSDWFENPVPSLWGITNSNLIYPPLKTNIHSQKLTKTNVFVPENRPLQKEIHLPVPIDLPIFQAMSCWYTKKTTEV